MAESALWGVVRKDVAPILRREAEASRLARASGKFKRGDRVLGVVDSDCELFCYRVHDHMLRFRGVQNSLLLTADLVSRVNPHPEDHSHGLLAVERHHLLVHRALAVAAYDTALRLVGAVLNLGIPERGCTKENITKNLHLGFAKSLKAALATIERTSEKYNRERQDAFHAGGIPISREVDWDSFYAEATAKGLGLDHPSVRAKFRKGFEVVAKTILNDASALSDAEIPFFDALMPYYEREKKMLRAVEEPRK